MSEIPEKAKDLCVELERLAADRVQIRGTMRSLDQMESRLRTKMEMLEQDLLDLLNTDDADSLDVREIGQLRIVLQRVDQYNSKPFFDVRYPDHLGVYTRVHYLRKPGQKRRPQKGG